MSKHRPEKKNTLDMSLKKFRHVRSTKDATTLQHEDGHVLTIAHKNLAPATKSQLQALSKIASQAATDDQANEMRDQRMAEGGQAGDDNPVTPVLKELMEYRGGSITKMAKGGDLDAPYTGTVPQAARDDYANADAQKQSDEERYGKATTKEVAPGTQHMKAGETQKFAEGGMSSADDQNASADRRMSQTPQDRASDDFRPEQVSAQPQEDPMVKAYKDEYDKRVAGAAAGIGFSADDKNPATFKGAGPGKLPLNFNPQLAQAAVQDTSKQLAQNDAAKSAQNSANIQLQGMAAKFGIDPTTVGPTPTAASPGAEMPGSSMNPALAKPSLLPNMDLDGKPLPGNQQGMPDDLQSAQATSMRGIGMQEAGNTESAQQMGLKGEQESSALTQVAQDDQILRENFKQSYDEIDGELKASIKDMQDGHIDPEAYWHGTKNPQTGQMEGGHSKLMAGIGMILAGFNPTNRPNAAAEMINQRIEQNIQAQVHNLASKNNIVQANLQHYNNLNQAMDASRIMLNQQAQHLLGAAASKFSGPLAAAQAKSLNGQLEIQKGQLMQNFAMTNMMYNLAGNKSMSPDEKISAYTRGIQMFRARGDMEKAKDLESHVVPGVGISPNQSVPESAKATFTSHREVNNLMNMSLDFSEKYGGANWLKYGPADRAKIMQQGKTIQNQLLGQVKQAQHDGVYKESEAKFLLGQIGTNPASFVANFSSVPGIRQMQQIKAQEYGNAAKSYGIENYKPLDTYSPVIMHKGIPVRKGPDGNYHRVK